MVDSDDLPRALVNLAEALRPVSGSLAAAWSNPPVRSLPCADAVAFVQDYLDRIDGHVEALAAVVNGEVARAIGPGGGYFDIQTAVSGLKGHIDRMRGDYYWVLSAKAKPADAHGVVLLGEIYRGLLQQVDDWINDIVAFVDDPAAEAAKRGLAASGSVHVEFWLTLELPPEASTLARWIDERSSRPHRDDEVRARGWGIGALAAAFGLGWLLGGDDGDE